MNIFYLDHDPKICAQNHGPMEIKKSVMLIAVEAVHDYGYTAIGVANELGVAPMDLDDWLEEFDELYYNTYNESY